MIRYNPGNNLYKLFEVTDEGWALDKLSGTNVPSEQKALMFLNGEQRLMLSVIPEYPHNDLSCSRFILDYYSDAKRKTSFSFGKHVPNDLAERDQVIGDWLNNKFNFALTAVVSHHG